MRSRKLHNQLYRASKCWRWSVTVATKSWLAVTEYLPHRWPRICSVCATSGAKVLLTFPEHLIHRRYLMGFVLFNLHSNVLLTIVCLVVFFLAIASSDRQFMATNYLFGIFKHFSVTEQYIDRHFNPLEHYHSDSEPISFCSYSSISPCLAKKQRMPIL